jgi:hypothetical protein
MPGLRVLNQWYFNKFDQSNATNDAADEIIASPDRHLLSQQQLFEAQGGINTVALALGASVFGTLLVFAGAPRTSAHFRNGQLGFYEWACLSTSALFWYNGASWVGTRSFGDH